MHSDLLEATSDPFRKTSIDESLLIVLLEAFSVEGVLEVLESESEVEDFDV